MKKNPVDESDEPYASDKTTTATITNTSTVSGHGTVSGPHQASRHDHLTLHFAKGTLTISINETSFAAHPNYRTCTAKETGGGTFTITTGTGSFHGATGAGTFNRHSTMFGTRTPNGACANKNTPPKVIQTTSTLVGKVTIPTS